MDDVCIEFSEFNSDNGVCLSEIIEDRMVKKMNVGGKMVEIPDEVMKVLKLDNLIKNDFIDRDYEYLEKIIKMVGNESDVPISDIIENENNQFVYEVYSYGLISKKPQVKISIKKNIKFTDGEIINFDINGIRFSTLSTTISQSSIPDSIDTEPKIFRQILNLLRHGELCVFNEVLINTLKAYGIEYKLHSSHPVDLDIICQYYHFNPSVFTNPVNAILTKSKMEFGNELVFDLTNTHLDEIYVCIDVPYINPTKNEYVDDLNSIIIDSVYVVSGKKKIKVQSSESIQMISTVFGCSENENKKQKLLYHDTLIDIVRLLIPLNGFNNFAIDKIIIKTAPCEKILKNTPSDKIPLLNTCIVGIFTEFKIDSYGIQKYDYNRVHIPTKIHDLYTVFSIQLYGTIKEIYLNAKNNGIHWIELIKHDKVISRVSAPFLQDIIPQRYIKKTMKSDWYYLNLGSFSSDDILLHVYAKKSVESVSATVVRYISV